MKLGLGTGSTAKHFVELLGARVRDGLDVVGVPTSEATRADAIRCGIRPDHAGRDRPARPDRRWRRRNRPLAQPHQGRRRRVAAGKDRCRGIRPDDRDCRRFQMGRGARPLSPADRGHSVRTGRDAARDRKRRLPNAAFPGKWWSERARTVTFSSPMVATGSSMPISGAYPMRRNWRDRWPPFRVWSSTGYSSASPASRCWPALREFALLSGASAAIKETSQMKSLSRILPAAGLALGLALSAVPAGGATARGPTASARSSRRRQRRSRRRKNS